jgi:hypothetical protein
LADSPASFMSSIIRVRNADIVCSFVIDGTTRLDADDSLTSYSSGDAATPPRLRHRRSRPFNPLRVGASQQLVEDSVGDARVFASRHRWAPFPPITPNLRTKFLTVLPPLLVAAWSDADHLPTSARVRA